MPHEVETMFSARELPWHGLGVVTESTLTADEAIKAGGIDWTVSKRPVFIDVEGERVRVPSRYAVVRDSDHKPLSVVGGHWQPLQNREAFDFLDALADEGLAYETAGSLRGGEVVFVTAKVPEGIMIGGEDRHDVYLFVRNPHNGRDAVTVGVTPIRVVCMNTMNLAMRTAKRTWRCPHLQTLKGRIAEARHSLDLTFEYMEDFRAQGDELLATEMSDRAFDDFLRKCVEDSGLLGPKATETATTRIKELWTGSPETVTRGTAWGAVNAIGEYFDWERDTRSDEARLLGSLDGIGRRMKDRAMALVS